MSNSIRGQFLLWAIIAFLCLLSAAVIYEWIWPIQLYLRFNQFLAVLILPLAILVWLLVRTLGSHPEPVQVSWWTVGVVVIFLAWAMEVAPFHESFVGTLLAFGVASVVGVKLDRFANQVDLPALGLAGATTRHQLSLLGAAVIVALAIGLLLVPAAPATAIEDVEPSWGDLPPSAEPDDVLVREYGPRFTFEVNLSPEPGHQLVVLVRPSGEVASAPLRPSESDRDVAIVELPAKELRSNHELGTHTVLVKSAWGRIIDQQTIEINRTPEISVTSSETDVKKIGGVNTTRIRIEVAYAGSFPMGYPDSHYVSYNILDTDGYLEERSSREIMEDGDKTTIRLFAKDPDGEYTQLAPGTYTVDVTYRTRDNQETEFTVVVPEE